MFGIGTGEILLILIIATLVVGPEQMVSFARDMGQLLAKFRQETDSVTEEFREALSVEPGTDGERGTESVAAASETGEDDAAAVAVAREGTPAEQEEKVEDVPIGTDHAFVDGEVESFASLEEEEDEKPVLIVVGEPVPKDEDVEPIVIEEPILVMDEEEDTGEER